MSYSIFSKWGSPRPRRRCSGRTSGELIMDTAPGHSRTGGLDHVECGRVTGVLVVTQQELKHHGRGTSGHRRTRRSRGRPRLGSSSTAAIMISSGSASPATTACSRSRRAWSMDPADRTTSSRRPVRVGDGHQDLRERRPAAHRLRGSTSRRGRLWPSWSSHTDIGQPPEPVRAVGGHVDRVDVGRSSRSTFDADEVNRSGTARSPRPRTTRAP